MLDEANAYPLAVAGKLFELLFCKALPLLYWLSQLRLFACRSPQMLSRIPSKDSIFSQDNLVAWCIVPFDAKKRGPEERGRNALQARI